MLEWLTKLKNKNKQSENVHYMHTANFPCDRVLETCADAGLESLTVVGWTKDGKLFMCTSHAKRGDVLWDMTVASKEIID